MTFLKTQRSKFIAWMFIYAGAVALMASKGGGEGMFFVWGWALGAGAGIATCIPGPLVRMKRLMIVAGWWIACFLLAFPLLWSELGSKSATLSDRAGNAAVYTLVCGFPALLALLVWIFRRPKSKSAAAAAPSV